MDILESGEIDCLVRKSGLAIKSNQSTDWKGKFELLEKKIIAVEVEQEKSLFPIQAVKEEGSIFEQLRKNTIVRP
jgi:hypothetical protein